ncbi:Legumin B, putative isoform 3 [Theobroma cacao]|uniref:Legumin B, putative isoform 3 n=1 Tax=Theobroma cacao TaxID=3641 RepID=A0A061EUU4_THECC|nr:Legumin B, putative isoform 3 [Theobroma cacao]
MDRLSLSWSRLLMLAIRPTSSIKTLEGLVTGGQSQSQGRSRRGQEEEQQESGGNNLLSAFKEQLLAEVFGIDTRLARKIQNEKDNRGAIVKVAHEFRFASPQSVEEEQRQRGSESEEEEEEEGQEERGQRRERREQRRGNRKQEGRQGRKGGSRSCNGLEETFCTMRLRHWTDSPFADVFNPRAGRITTVNSYNLPVLQFLQLSAERGVLYKNAFYAPHWNTNASPGAVEGFKL